MRIFEFVPSAAKNFVLREGKDVLFVKRDVLSLNRSRIKRMCADNLKDGVNRMNQNAELLNFVYQNAQMGVVTISQLLDIVEDTDMREQLQSERNEYQKIHDEAAQLLLRNGYDEKGISAFERIRTYMMINFQTMTDKTPSHIAEMMMVGSTMGIVQATRNIRKYRDSVEKDIVGLMKTLLMFEENNFQDLKEFL